jgi:hypothetical protein
MYRGLEQGERKASLVPDYRSLDRFAELPPRPYHPSITENYGAMSLDYGRVADDSPTTLH